MTLEELVLNTRSTRGFDESVKVTREQLLSFVDLARQTASTQNKQPLKYFLSYTAENNEKIQGITVWAAALRHLDLPKEGHRPTAFIVVLVDKRMGEPSVFMRDVGIAAQTIMLAATEKGLSGCMIGNFSAQKISAALGLAPELYPALILGLGAGDETVKLVPMQNGEYSYWRDENGVHYVPKRDISEIVIE